MKRKSIISLLIFCMSLGMVTTSCEDMLKPNSERHSYEVAEDTLYSYWGILKSLQNVAERYVILGECRGDLVTSTGYVSDTIAAIVNFGQNGTAAKYKDGASKYLKASDYYHIINSCNAYIAHCDTFQTTGTNQKYMIKEYAQVQAIRAWTYMQLVQVYGEVPFYTKPLLTTKEIDEFWNSDYPTANAGNLVDLLAPELINMEFVEKIYGYPQYNKYGRTSAVCHSSLCMFPVSVVLGDLYLMEGSAASCAKAAQHYYNYLNTEYGGPLLTDIYCTGNLTERSPLPSYELWDPMDLTPYTNKEKVSADTEGVTCIPSSTNKLWGTVLTDVNRLFGFEAEIHVSTYETGDEDEEQSTATVASVSLSRQEDPELVASAGYDTICMKQDYEMYIGDYENPDQAVIKVMPKVGDARQYWNSRYIYMNEMDKMDTMHYVMKQNPSTSSISTVIGARFTTVYPMVYRKTGIWLRFAEAINRAGYPSYAFAVLKNGLCNNDYWYPDAETDYATKDSLWYAVYNDSIYLPYNIPVGDEINADSILGTTYCKTKAELIAAIAEHPDSITAADVTMNYLALSTENYTDESCSQTCYYLDKREVMKSKGIDYMNFMTRYMRSSTRTVSYEMKKELRGNGMSMFSYPSNPTADNYITTGIHARGGGRLRYDDRNSSYNYVTQVIKKVKENEGIEITKEDIYSGNYDAEVQDAVEDLIIDECALELAFEGNRFFDLMRVARRRGTDYLASRVAKRNGTEDAAMRSFLQNEKHWYLPLPVNE